MVICPASTCGKNSWPMQQRQQRGGKQGRDAEQHLEAMPQGDLQEPAVDPGHRSEERVDACKPPEKARA